MKSIPFFKPYIDEKEHTLIENVLTLSDPTMVNTFEENITKFLGIKNAVSTNNGTAAKHLALSAMDLKRGDKIICSVNIFPAVAEVIRHFDAEPIFVDIDKDDFNIDTNKLEQALDKHKNRKLKAAFITHVAGQSADIKIISELAKKYHIKIIDDASRALGATYKGKKIGSFDSYISCFQFNPQMRHSISSAGVLATNDEEITKRAKLLRNHAIINEDWDKFGNLGYVYDVVDIGLKYDLDELSAAYAIAQLEKIDSFIEKRVKLAKIYDKELKNCPHISTPIKKRDHIYTQYIIKVDKNRDSFAKDLREKGIHTALHYIPIHLLNYYKNKYSLKVNDFPIALSNYQQILSLPIYAALSEEDVYFVCETIKNIAKNRV